MINSPVSKKRSTRPGTWPLFGLLFCLTATVFGKVVYAETSTATDSAPQETATKVRLATNLGEMVIELYPEQAPKSVDNFLEYVNAGFYTDTIFHRVIEGFMIQGGGFDLAFEQKETRTAIDNEADNQIKNDKFTVAMARTNAPHSATSQFFINTADNDFLNFREKNAAGWGYTVFGKIIEGERIAEWISKAPTGAAGPFRSDVPLTPIVIEEVSVIAAQDDNK